MDNAKCADSGWRGQRVRIMHLTAWDLLPGMAKNSPPPLRNVGLATPLHLQLASRFDHSSCTV
jgi:hypothetical protein